MDNSNMVYMAYDGDNAGRLVGRSILANDPEALSEVSSRINLGHEIVHEWVQEHGGQVISGGGDEGTFSLPQEAIELVEQLRADYQFATNLTMTIGIGSTLSEAGKSLLVGKFRGKNTVVQYDPSIEEEIHAAEKHMEEGSASPEERKLGEAYLKPDGGNAAVLKDSKKPEQEESHDDCPYCKQLDEEKLEDPDHCKYCHDMDNVDENEEECPYCKEMDSSSEGDDQKVDAEAGPSTNLPTTQSSQDYTGQDLNKPIIDKPDPNSEPKMGLGTSTDVPTNSNEKLDEQGEMNEENAQINAEADGESKEAMQAIAEEIEGGNSQDEKDVMDNIDAEDLAVGANMEDNVSRPEGFEENVPSDMGLGEDEQGEESPDITEVLQSGLDSQADDIQREKVIQLVSQALEDFKGCKDILERAKEQAPQLYTSSIAMLKAMIEMARMLGLEESPEVVEEAPVEEIPQESQDESSIDFNDPFPQHPDHDGGSKEQAPKEQAPQESEVDFNNLFPQHPDHAKPAASEGAAKDPKQRGQ